MSSFDINSGFKQNFISAVSNFELVSISIGYPIIMLSNSLISGFAKAL